MSTVKIAIMNDKIWNIITGNEDWMDWSSSKKIVPESKLVNHINWLMRAIVSIAVLFMYGKFFRVAYNNGDVIYVEWKNFRYEVEFVYANDGVLVDSGIFLGSDW